ncbi:MAG: hypothetical protein IJT04_04285 [Bacteroidales bacterium]|nr:hypothetical protein [Bacteroidales bacterium]
MGQISVGTHRVRPNPNHRVRPKLTGTHSMGTQSMAGDEKVIFLFTLLVKFAPSGSALKS